MGAVVVAGALALTVAGAPATAPDVALGQRMYRDGLLPSGQPLHGILQGDLPAEGSHLQCMTCHRRSGFGSSEGATFVPPITGPSLFQPSELQRADRFRKLYEEDLAGRFWVRVREQRARPAYTDDTLAAALREGKDPTGRTLDPLMPRYMLSDEDMGHLIAYLKSLSSTPVPGVDASAIHFATVVTDGVEPAKRQAMHAVMDAYVRWKNTDTRGLVQRPGHSPWHKDDFYGAYRTWVLHVWELRGPADTWPVQLNTYYRAQPVFALLSGIGGGEWRPVHDFCERAEMPCLFPHTDLPVISPPGAYALYFSKGLTVEAEALASYLHEQSRSITTRQIVQVYRDTASGRVPAQALRQALQGYGKARLQDRVIDSAQGLAPTFWKHLVQDEQPAILVLWLEDMDVEGLRSLLDSTDGLQHLQQLYLSSSLLRETLPSVPEGLRAKIRLTYPFALPELAVPQLYRVRAWLRARGVKGTTHERLQLNTHLVLEIADHALEHLGENFSRDFFIERIEDMMENVSNPGVFPYLSLGPGQRFASKGCYIVKLSDRAKGGLEAVSDWISP